MLVETSLSARTLGAERSVLRSVRKNFSGAETRPVFMALLLLFALVAAPNAALAKKDPKPHNILFVIMDDVGIDQMRLFGYGGDGGPVDGRVPAMPNLEAIANEGVAFRNTWAMPACSTSRAVFFTGRYPLRTNVMGALGQNDLANAMVSPYEVTLPKLLSRVGYQNALFGKFHLGLQGHNPFGNSMTSALGWDYFYGWLDETGDPSSIDTTAGLGNPEDGGPYSCGFVPGYGQNTGMGADSGACYTAKGTCEDLLTSADDIPPGRTCRDSGGILDPNESCAQKMPANIKDGFANLNGHYVSPLFIVGKNGKSRRIDTTDIRARTFRGSAVVDGAIDWINDQPKSKPWMASVSFSSAHTPAMQPPQALLNQAAGNPSSLSCATVSDDEKEQVKLDLNQRELTTELIEALDTELARLLVSIGVAGFNSDGILNYAATDNDDTMIVILGDNGTLASAVKTPFDPFRAKGTAYQTGVWVPLVIAGPLVNGTNRMVKSMVNIADLYYLFGEIAGIDVPANVPRQIDAEPMLAYLQEPAQETIREYNFTQVAPNAQAGFALNQPCTIGNGCTQIPVSKGVCMDNGGIWWGDKSDVPDVKPGGFAQCCEVNGFIYDQAIAAHDKPGFCDDPKNADECNPKYFKQQPLTSMAIRNQDFKVVRNSFVGEQDANPFDAEVKPSCVVPDPPLPDEFYAVSEGDDDPINQTVIDIEKLNLVDEDGNPPDELRPIYDDLVATLDGILKSEKPCGTDGDEQLWSFDGNLDGVIDEQDLNDLNAFAQLAQPGSSWYDVTVDGYTLVDAVVDGDVLHASDYDLIEAKLGTVCAPE